MKRPPRGGNMLLQSTKIRFFFQNGHLAPPRGGRFIRVSIHCQIQTECVFGTDILKFTS